MPLQVSISKIIADGMDCTVYFNLVKSSTYVTAVGGDAIDFTKAVQDAAFQGPAAQLPADAAPVSISVWDVSGNLATGLIVTLGALQTNSKVQILSDFNVELGSGAYPSPMKLQGCAVFHKNQ